jgi:long-chain acyl-CoA synthetase
VGDIEFTTPCDYAIDSDTLGNVCTIVYTAADDGYAKGAMLTKSNLASNAASLSECANITPQTTSCALLPFSHLFGLQTGAITPISTGGSFVIPEVNLSHIASTARRIEGIGVTELYSIPAVYYLLSKLGASADWLRKVRNLTSGAYKLSPRIARAFHRNTGRAIQEGYGLAEASPICTWHRRGDTINADSVGRPLPGCSVQPLDDKGNVLPRGVEGELAIRGANVMAGYWRRAESTSHTLRNGWLRTGDIGMTNAAEYVFLTGRKKRMLNVGGRKVYLAEMERLLSKPPYVTNVSIHTNVDKNGAEQAVAYIQLDNNDLHKQHTHHSWCESHISAYKLRPLHILYAPPEA